MASLFYVLLGYVLAAKEHYKTLYIVAFIEIEFNASVSSIMLGQGYEFMIYTLTLIPGAFYMAYTWPEDSKNKHGVSMIPIISTIIVGAMYLIVEVMYTITKPFYTGELLAGTKPIFHYFNILVAVILLLAFSILFALEVRYIQKLLHDENSRLGEIAARDPLTKAFNRRSFYQILNDQIDGGKQLNMGLILLDIDNFKKVNDTYGHIVGDQVLIGVSTVLKENLRENDQFCRWGGEEFLMLIHGNEEDFTSVAERIRMEIAKRVFNAEDVAFSVTATLGIAAYQQGTQIRAVVELADQKLYYGKTHGKNQVVK